MHLRPWLLDLRPWLDLRARLNLWAGLLDNRTRLNLWARLLDNRTGLNLRPRLLHLRAWLLDRHGLHRRRLLNRRLGDRRNGCNGTSTHRLVRNNRLGGNIRHHRGLNRRDGGNGLGHALPCTNRRHNRHDWRDRRDGLHDILLSCATNGGVRRRQR